MAANLISKILRALTNKVEVVKFVYVFNLFLKRRQWLMKGIKKILWFFGAAKKLSKSRFRQLLYLAIAKTELIFFWFFISFA